MSIFLLTQAYNYHKKFELAGAVDKDLKITKLQKAYKIEGSRKLKAYKNSFLT